MLPNGTQRKQESNGQLLLSQEFKHLPERNTRLLLNFKKN